MKQITIETKGGPRTFLVGKTSKLQDIYHGLYPIASGVSLVLDHSKGELAKMIGLKVFDYALPQAYWDEQYKMGKDTRNQVWCYDENGTWGEPVDILQTFIRDYRQLILEALVTEAMLE